jgi:hypothetical protein
MLDIVSMVEGQDLKFADTAVTKAANVISIQIGDLSYAPTFGVDLKYFLRTDLQFQNASFKSYLVQRLVEHQVNVSSVATLIDDLLTKYTFYVDDPNRSVSGLIL